MLYAVTTARRITFFSVLTPAISFGISFLRNKNICTKNSSAGRLLQAIAIYHMSRLILLHRSHAIEVHDKFHIGHFTVRVANPHHAVGGFFDDSSTPYVSIRSSFTSTVLPALKACPPILLALFLTKPFSEGRTGPERSFLLERCFPAAFP